MNWENKHTRMRVLDEQSSFIANFLIDEHGAEQGCPTVCLDLAHRYQALELEKESWLHSTIAYGYEGFIKKHEKLINTAISDMQEQDPHCNLKLGPINAPAAYIVGATICEILERRT